LKYAVSCFSRAQGCVGPIRMALVPCCPIAVKPRQSSRHTWSNQRPNGRFWATLPVGLTRVNGSHHLVPPTTACTGGHPLVDACMQSGSEWSPWSMWSLSYTAHHVRRRHCRPVSLVADPSDLLVTCSVAEDLDRYTSRRANSRLYDVVANIYTNHFS